MKGSSILWIFFIFSITSCSSAIDKDIESVKLITNKTSENLIRCNKCVSSESQFIFADDKSNKECLDVCKSAVVDHEEMVNGYNLLVGKYKLHSVSSQHEFDKKNNELLLRIGSVKSMAAIETTLSISSKRSSVNKGIDYYILESGKADAKLSQIGPLVGKMSENLLELKKLVESIDSSVAKFQSPELK